MRMRRRRLVQCYAVYCYCASVADLLLPAYESCRENPPQASLKQSISAPAIQRTSSPFACGRHPAKRRIRNPSTQDDPIAGGHILLSQGSGLLFRLCWPLHCFLGGDGERRAQVRHKSNSSRHDSEGQLMMVWPFFSSLPHVGMSHFMPASACL